MKKFWNSSTGKWVIAFLLLPFALATMIIFGFVILWFAMFFAGLLQLAIEDYDWLIIAICLLILTGMIRLYGFPEKIIGLFNKSVPKPEKEE